MRTIHRLAAVAALLVALPVLATPTTTVYDFNSATTSGTTYTTFGDAASYGGLYNGTYFGNSATYAGTGGTALSTTVTAWASTGLVGSSAAPTSGVNGTSSSGYVQNGSIQNAVLSAYQTSNGGTGTFAGTGYSLAETSRNTNGGYLNHDFSCSNSTCTPDTPQHAIDNAGAYETLLFSFSSAVTLSNITLGYPTVGSANAGSSDLTVLYCKATTNGVYDPTKCASSTFAGQTYSQLVSSGNWGYTDLFDLSSTNDTGSTGLNTKSTLWMVGAYIADLPNQYGNDNNPDYVKIRSITTCTSAVCAVPEPGSLALFGIAGSALWVGRRRRQLRVA